MFFSTTMGGMCMAAPDVCKTPAPPLPSPVPIPYPNIAGLNMATNTSTKVKIVNMEAVTLKSKIPSSNGDEAGVAGGVVSNINLGVVKFTMGSLMVKIEGQPAIKATSPSAHNGSNSNMPAGMQTVPSQFKVMILA